MNRFEFFDRIPAMSQRKRQQIQWAYVLAKKYHDGQTRDSGERYFEHVRGVALILIAAGYTDAESIILAILHDVLEDTTIPLSLIEQLFGPRIARGVLAMSKTYGIEDPLTGFITHTKKRTKEEYFAGLRRAGKKSVRGKCADRIHNLSDLVGEQAADSRWTPAKRLAQVEETREWILPLAREFEPRFAERLEGLCAQIEASARREMSLAV